MKDLLGLLFGTDGFPPRWHCGDWSALHGWTHICSDAAIFGAYAAIPAALIYFALKRKDVPFLPIFWLFGAFILACGTGHLIEASLFWHPWYRFSAAMKVATALVSWGTVVALVRILPQALELPGLAKLNRELSHEVGERRKAMTELRRVEASESAILNAALDAIMSIDDDGRVVAWNRSAEQMFGYSKDDAIGQRMDELIIPAALRERHRAGLQRMAAGGEAHVLGKLLEMPAVRANGTELTVELFITRIDAEGPARFTGFLRDITERKQIEAQRLAALEESEMLLREVHHRVKNNMQVISSLLRLHSGKVRDPAQLAVFTDCRDRIQAMALIHERLYTAGKFARIEFGGYLAEMVRMTLGSSIDAGARVRLDLQLDPLELQLDTAMPLSLVASELVLNALKHAFTGTRTGTLTVKLRAGDPLHELVVQDDGPGLPADFSPEQGAGIGSELVESLTRQVRGERHVAAGPGGTTVTIRWPAQRATPPENSALSHVAN
jgi:PAS domain S-box-containing protein